MKISYELVGTGWDFLMAGLVAFAIGAAWIEIFILFGDTSATNNGFVTFIGGVLAISGLLFRQYMFKEVLDYLKNWDRLNTLLEQIIETSLNFQDEDQHIEKFKNQISENEIYTNYVRRELTIVPLIPLVLIFCYGSALLSEGSFLLRSGCLFGMIYCVCYLAIAATTSARLACSYPALENTIGEMEETLLLLREQQRGNDASFG